jgi:hypothetical protein
MNGSWQENEMLKLQHSDDKMENDGQAVNWDTNKMCLPTRKKRGEKID